MTTLLTEVDENDVVRRVLDDAGEHLYDASGALVSTRPLTAQESAAVVRYAADLDAVTNARAVLAKIEAAIAANAAVESSMNTVIAGVNTFAAIASPTTAQRNQFLTDLGTAVKMIAQDQKAQARQLTALARHAAADFTSTSGT